MDVCENGELPSEFEKGEKKLIPLIFLHGLSMNRTTNSGTCKDFSSHGYIVFTIDHEDGTSSYTKSQDGSIEKYYNNSMEVYDLEGRRAQLQIREAEAATLIDEIVQDGGKSMLKRLGFS